MTITHNGLIKWPRQTQNPSKKRMFTKAQESCTNIIFNAIENGKEWIELYEEIPNLIAHLSSSCKCVQKRVGIEGFFTALYNILDFWDLQTLFWNWPSVQNKFITYCSINVFINIFKTIHCQLVLLSPKRYVNACFTCLINTYEMLNPKRSWLRLFSIDLISYILFKLFQKVIENVLINAFI